MQTPNTTYKNTEIGSIPVDWEVKELGKICFPSKIRINPITTTKNFKCIELEHLSQGSGILLGYAQTKNLLSQKSVFEVGDVLFGKLRPYLRKYFLANFEGVCTTEIWVLKTEKDISNIFLYHLIQSDKVIEAANISTGTKMPRAEWKTVSETIVAIPTLTEQTAIANALSDADALINNVEKLITKKRNIKQGVMQKLLQPKEDWEVKKLGDFCEFTQGIQISTSNLYKHPREGLIRYLYIRDFFTNDFQLYVANLYPSKIMRSTDIMMINTGNTAGRVYSGAYGVLSNNAFKISFNENVVCRDYLFELLKSGIVQNSIQELFNSSGQPHVGHKNIAKVKIPFPPLQTQIEIAQILTDMDLEIAGLEGKLSKYRAIKTGMMQQLLTGRIRLV